MNEKECNEDVAMAQASAWSICCGGSLIKGLKTSVKVEGDQSSPNVLREPDKGMHFKEVYTKSSGLLLHKDRVPKTNVSKVSRDCLWLYDPVGLMMFQLRSWETYRQLSLWPEHSEHSTKASGFDFYYSCSTYVAKLSEWRCSVVVMLSTATAPTHRQLKMWWKGRQEDRCLNVFSVVVCHTSTTETLWVQLYSSMTGCVKHFGDEQSAVQIQAIFQIKIDASFADSWISSALIYSA